METWGIDDQNKIIMFIIFVLIFPYSDEKSFALATEYWRCSG